MKQIKLVLIIMVAITGINTMAQNAWNRLTPTPQENTINDITRIPGTDRLMTVGEGSTIMTSDDAGETWDIMLNPAGRNNQYICKGVHFISETIGFINGGRETILKTTDGGQNWNLEYAGNTIYDWQCINDIEFCTDTRGFAVGDNGQLLETNDVGESWQIIESGVMTDLQQIVFADSLTGYIFQGNSTCLKTTDGGLTWNAEPLAGNLPDGTVYDCIFTDSSTGFVFINENSMVESTGYIYRTNDAGETWNLVHLDATAYTGKFSFFNEQQGMIACMTAEYLTKVLLTNNGGSTWNEIEYPWLPWWSTYGLIYLDQNNAITVGLKGMIYKSSDAGESWQAKQSRLFSGGISEAQFLDEDIGYTLTDAGGGGVAGVGIMKTEDGGNNWDYIYINNWSYNLDFDFLTADTGFAVTESFHDTISLLITTDGGENWTEITTSHEFTPTDIEFIDENNGIICGEYIVIRTSDAGQTWQDITPGEGWFSFNEIEYHSATEVYITGSGDYGNGLVFKSTDEGDTWQTILDVYYGPATHIALPEENTILVTTIDKIYKSVDNGTTWNQSTSTNPNLVEYKSLYFSSPTFGYVVGNGDFANIEKTTDGGDTWFPLVTNESSTLNAAWFFDDENGMIFGDNGIVIETSTGGVTGVVNSEPGRQPNCFSVNPNPVSDNINIHHNHCSEKISFPVQLTLTDIAGKTILERQISNPQTEIRIATETLKPGMYIAAFTNHEGLIQTLKVIRL